MPASGLLRQAGRPRRFKQFRIESECASSICLDGILRRIRQDKRHAESLIKVPSTRLDTLWRAHALKKIDYCSIDGEGAERAVFRSLDFDEFDIAVLSVENNHQLQESQSYRDIMGPAGYRPVAVIGMDEIWAKESAAQDLHPERPQLPQHDARGGLDAVLAVGSGDHEARVVGAGRPAGPGPGRAGEGEVPREVPRHLRAVLEDHGAGRSRDAGVDGRAAAGAEQHRVAPALTVASVG